MKMKYFPLMSFNDLYTSGFLSSFPPLKKKMFRSEYLRIFSPVSVFWRGKGHGCWWGITGEAAADWLDWGD